MGRENLIRNLLIPGFVVCLIFQQAILIRAAPGDLDYSFGFLGVKIDNDDIYNMEPKAIAQQSDGKLLVVGNYFTDAYQTRRVLLRRYNTNGSVDYGFGLSGFGVTQIFPSTVEVYGAASDLSIQRGGKIVVVGRDFSSRPAVWSFEPNGELDAAFGDEGMVTVDNSDISSANRVIVTQGKLLVYITRPIDGVPRLIRLNGDGTLDTSFGVSGGVDLGINDSYGPAMTVNPSTGQIIVGGAFDQTPALQYFNQDGTPDTTQGPDGIVTIPHSANCGSYTMTPRKFTSLALQPDGRIIAGGYVDNIGGCLLPSCYGNSVIRLRPNNVLDTGYGSGGFSVKCDGRVGGPKLKLVSGTSKQILVKLGTPIGGNSAKLRRFSSAGFLNLIFTNESPVDFLSQQGDEKIVTVNTSSSSGIRLARYLP